MLETLATLAALEALGTLKALETLEALECSSSDETDNAAEDEDPKLDDSLSDPATVVIAYGNFFGGRGRNRQRCAPQAGQTATVSLRHRESLASAAVAASLVNKER